MRTKYIGDFLMNFGNRVRIARLQKKMTQKELGILLGVQQPTIQRIENGENAGTKHINQLSKILDIDLAWLLSGEINENNSESNENNSDIKGNNNTQQNVVNGHNVANFHPHKPQTDLVSRRIALLEERINEFELQINEMRILCTQLKP